MLKKIFIIVCLLIIGGISFIGIRRYKEVREKEANRNAKREMKPIPVNMVLVEKKTMRDERRFSGTALAWSEFDIEPKVSGKLLRLNYDIGDQVKRGDLIAQIDDEEYVQQLCQEEANLEYARAKLKESQGLVNIKQREFDRQSRLLISGATSETTFDTAKSDLESEQASLEMCKAEVKRCEAKRSNAKLKLADTRIVAEWGEGSDVRYVGTRYVDEGTLLPANKPVLSIVDLKQIKAHIQIIERDYPFIREGQKTAITTDAYPDEVFEGTISKISNKLSEKTRSAVAVVSIKNDDLKLRPGMFLRAHVLLGEHKNVQTVPLLAVMQKKDGQFIFCFKDGQAVLTQVKTGLTNETSVEILQPVIKTPVVTVGNHLLDNGRSIVMSELSREQMAEKASKSGESPK